jgi:hypothetical protein
MKRRKISEQRIHCCVNHYDIPKENKFGIILANIYYSRKQYLNHFVILSNTIEYTSLHLIMLRKMHRKNVLGLVTGIQSFIKLLTIVV